MLRERKKGIIYDFTKLSSNAQGKVMSMAAQIRGGEKGNSDAYSSLEETINEAARIFFIVSGLDDDKYLKK